MPQYLVAIYLPDDYDPSTQTEETIEEIHAANREMTASGALKFACGLFPASHAKSLRWQPDGTVSVTDGPYTEAKEHMDGFSVLEAADLDEAIEWARKGAASGTRAGSEKPLYQQVSEEYADSDRNWVTIDSVVRIAKATGATPSQVALSWIADRPGVVAPIVGARTAEHLRNNLCAADLILSKEATAELEKVSAPQPGGYPYGAFGAWQRGRSLEDGNPAPPPPFTAGSRNPTGRA